MELNLSDSELVVMRVVWSLGEGSLNQINDSLLQRFDWSISTVKTFLARLVKKELLVTRRDGRKYIYSPTCTEDEAIHTMTSEFLRKVCAKKHISVLLQAVQESDFTKADKNLLEQTLAQKESVEQVTCDCMSKMDICSC
ncbi:MULTISPECIES: CopY/TcrY family copper transport repressor [unclassified Lactococcus]|uniref:CopY/TcrY family copper transport repressor n=1 Tax=unclassified Lactococcus TaxID=2643510 RepID=UPI0011CC0610|nr:MULTISPECIES: CopY/TcrY family copper transport repressor [unclassified Lactococcus]MQW23085.1 CopY/TcrY family copper transport repressor [Lactococcus sp. dk101]TXK44430.1 CopY/TcrY family copper transport repressor [Lactococcus sp. dk310]TXK50240.1 CopY/TcrY family copper transport repressor [Lactococcus sp. dk322]